MIQCIKNLFKSKDKEQKISIFTILNIKYCEYGEITGIIYLTKEEYEEYKKVIILNNNYIGRLVFMECEVEIDPAILREEKLKQLGL
jgi:hypothetical protein